VVFDTNIYGKSYVLYHATDENYIKHEDCGTETAIHYLKGDVTTKDSEIMWGLVKLFFNIRTAFNETIYNQYIRFLQSKLPNLLNHIKYAQDTLIYLKNKHKDKVNYFHLLNKEDKFIQVYRQMSLPPYFALTEYISVLNFYGDETYFTRGAFIDTVINSQTCVNSHISLEDYNYISSILENVGFFFIHSGKVKYFHRVIKSTNGLVSHIGKTRSENIIKFLNTINHKLYNHAKFNPRDSIKQSGAVIQDGKLCNIISDDAINDIDFDILKCNQFDVSRMLFRLTYKILQYYNDSMSTPPPDGPKTFPFYYLFVKKLSGNRGIISPNADPDSNTQSTNSMYGSIYDLSAYSI
jgi:hypothetical protein